MGYEWGVLKCDRIAPCSFSFCGFCKAVGAVCFAVFFFGVILIRVRARLRFYAHLTLGGFQSAAMR